MTDLAYHRDGDHVSVEFWYPRVDSPDTVRTITVGLMDVRAADDIEITYDFDRDGYSIKREVMTEEGVWHVHTGEFVEVAFIPAWTTKETQ